MYLILIITILNRTFTKPTIFRGITQCLFIENQLRKISTVSDKSSQIKMGGFHLKEKNECKHTKNVFIYFNQLA